MKTIILDILPFLSAEASNILPALVCLLALCGASARVCILLTLLIHLGLALV